MISLLYVPYIFHFSISFLFFRNASSKHNWNKVIMTFYVSSLRGRNEQVCKLAISRSRSPGKYSMRHWGERGLGVLQNWLAGKQLNRKEPEGPGRPGLCCWARVRCMFALITLTEYWAMLAKTEPSGQGKWLLLLLQSLGGKSWKKTSSFVP